MTTSLVYADPDSSVSGENKWGRGEGGGKMLDTESDKVPPAAAPAAPPAAPAPPLTLTPPAKE